MHSNMPCKVLGSKPETVQMIINKQTKQFKKKKRLKCGAKQGYFHSGSISLFLYSSDANGDPVWMQF